MINCKHKISEKIFEAEDIPLSERFTNFLDQLRNANNELDNILNLNPELGITLDTQILWEVEINLPDRLLGIDTYIEFLDTMPENLDAFQFVRDMYEKVNDVNDFVDGIKGLIEPFNYIKKLESFATTEFEFSCWFQRTEAFTASVSIFFGFYCLFEEIYNIYSLLSNDINYSSSSFALKLTIAIGKTVVAGLAIASGGIQILLTVSGYALSETLLAMSEVLPVVGIVLTFSVKFLDAIDNINDAWEEGGLNAGIKQAWIEVLDLVFPILSFDIMKTLAETGKLELMCWYLITPMFADLIISLFLEQPVASQIQIIPSYDVIWEDAEGYPLSYINFPIRNTWIGNSLTLGDVLEFKITFLNNGTVFSRTPATETVALAST